MDQLSAHLDRGWDLAQRGDVRGAEASARRAIELNPSSPESYNLLGFVSALDGDCSEAIEAYQQAVMLDDTYVEAMLNAAELLVHPLGDFDEAILLCSQVLDITEFEDEILDAKLLQLEANLSKGDEARARKVLASLPAGEYKDPTHNYLAGRAHFELGDFDRAEVLLDAALQAEAQQPEALYYRGLLYEQRGDMKAASMMYLHVREGLLALGPPPWVPDPETLLMLTEKAVSELSGPAADMLRDASVFIVDLPGPEMVVDGVDVQTPAMIERLPQQPDEPDGPGELRVFLYLLNILRTASCLEEVQGAIQEALQAELASLADELTQLSE
jgi:Flp pilus assembly protein TadD